MKSIKIRGARVHNLKNIDIDIPRDKLVVITGLSGSGKSSLAFDTIYAEGQRRYVESLSAYARQFLGLMDKPDVDQIEGLSPAISIDQKSTSKNPRSTVGTVTEIYDYVRLLFARVGKPHCPKCGIEIKSQSPTQITDSILGMQDGKKLIVMAPVVTDRKGEHKDTLEGIRKSGFVRIRLDGTVMEIDEAIEKKKDKNKKHSIDVVVDRIIISKFEGDISEHPDRSRIADSVETALDFGNGIIILLDPETKEEKTISEHFACAKCGISIPEIQPRLFSFNSPHGACTECSGLGLKLEVDPDLVIPNKKLSLREGAIRPWSRTQGKPTWYMRHLEALAKEFDFSMDAPVSKLSKKTMDLILYGAKDKEIVIEADTDRFSGTFNTHFEGVIPQMERRYKETDSDYVRTETERYMRTYVCPSCNGTRLKKEALSIILNKKNIAEVSAMNIGEAIEFFNQTETTFSKREKQIAKQVMKEIKSRLEFLIDVGVAYLTLNRASATLAGGEAQRIRLATQIGSGLTGVLYILDEPSIGLHQRDNQKLIDTLKRLKDLGNTVIVVEHDEEMMREADYIIDIGPGAGEYGGEVIFEGTPEQIKKSKTSLTGQYLSGKEVIEVPKKRRKGNGKFIVIKGAKENNLKNIDAKIPLGKLVAVTGVSGSGKSTLIHDILSKVLAKEFYGAKDAPGEHKTISGIENIDKVVTIDQSPIGRSPRSNPATYTGVFTFIRDLFAQTPEARMRGYKAGRFSFNVKGGRCEACQGDGFVKIEMQFLPDIYVECDECKGKRYNKEALDIHYKEKTISDVLDMNVEEAMGFFGNVPLIKRKLRTLFDVGLGYIKIGQPATTLSGGEAQRIKLATELSRRDTGKTLYILDEPTTGLHFDDIKRLLEVLQRLVDKGNSVLVIEHQLDIIKSADHIIDLGMEGGEGGGSIIAEGTPEKIVSSKKGYTSKYLAKAIADAKR